MKAKLISDTTLKVTISMNDLEERGMELSDFIMPQEKTEDFFYTMLDEVDLPDHFKMEGMLSFRVTPKSDRVDIFVTKSDVNPGYHLGKFSKMEDFPHLTPDEFFKQLEQEMFERGDSEALKRLEEAEAADIDLDQMETDEQVADEVSDYVHYVLSFDSLHEVVAFTKLLELPVAASEIYKYQDSYRLTVLIYVEDKPRNYPDAVYAQLLEHAKEAPETRSYLREHAILLREGGVTEELAQVRV